MSGIYIHGMEMPKRGHTVTITIVGSGETYVEYYDCKPHVEETIEYKAIPVSDHGRLIDKDVMCKECRRVAEEYDGIYPDCTYCPANLAPTIIPADHIGDANEMVADKEGEG